MSLKTAMHALLACAIWSGAAQAGDVAYSRVPAATMLADWQRPESLPRQFRNHCGIVNGQYSCADHCGAGYQLYYCSPVAFGCCHAGFGYCDGDGKVRCSPYWDWPF
jgi:hypothetical protein